MNILCFGDSNTYGISPVDGKRFNDNERWPSLLGIKLGAGYQVIEAGQPNRTLTNEPPFSGDKLGVKYLEPYLRAYHVDALIIQLGTNDLKRRFALSVADIANALDTLIIEIKNHYLHRELPKIVVLSPPKIYEVGAYQSIYAGAANKVRQLTAEYKLISERHNCHFINGYELISPCPTEGIHWPQKEHKLLAEHLFQHL
ncbi:GDSL-type esterase/lipase family protein [Pseudoalteromonas lipolytica]|uniref:GDSL-type esterase/lipase family protein n=1 Tax=Pseudoalteromonas lipolytica TaxID=570156 RepID=UPI003A969106